MEKVLKKYRERLASCGLEPVRHPTEAIPTSKESALAHCLWMIGEAEKFLQSGDEESVLKAHRWLGFIQGVLWAFQVFPVDDLKADNRSL